jgi:cell wall-associated NlpC family hydrolase
MTGAEVVARARSAMGGGCIYRLGKGGFNPKSIAPWSKQFECDCSGFASWCLGVHRKTDNPWYVQFNGGWFETSAIVRDALSPFGVFTEVARFDVAPGDLLVWGDANGQQGHVGIVSGTATIIHCSKGNWTLTQDAIRETAMTIFDSHKAIGARCAWVEVSNAA